MQPNDIIRLALVDIGALDQEESVTPGVGTDALMTLNMLIDQWSLEHLMVYAVQEIIHELTAGQYVYTIGPGGSAGAAFTGSLAGNVLTVTTLTSGAVSLGQVIAGPGVPPGCTITALGTAFGGSGTNALGTYIVNQAGTVASQALTSSATRPVRINTAMVRIFNTEAGTLDYPVAPLSFDQYSRIGIKSLPGPWPRGVYYEPSEPVGILHYWPNPGQGEMHLFCDQVLSPFQTLFDTVALPPGYQQALRWGLAELLMPSYGKSDQMQIAMVSRYAAQAKAWIKRANQKPQAPVRFDEVLLGGHNKDAGWILSGGFA
jgi:hypothetical protein